ncbi:hypothetical protein NPIL_376321, partial [Nephila pilipes]
MEKGVAKGDVKRSLPPRHRCLWTKECYR